MRLDARRYPIAGWRAYDGRTGEPIPRVAFADDATLEWGQFDEAGQIVNHRAERIEFATHAPTLRIWR